MSTNNGVMIQYFQWYLNDNIKFWNQLSNDAKHLAKVGFTSVWMPPAYKGYSGKNDVGYGVYDLYDLGEFNQKGSIPTKYGTKDEYLKCIKSLHNNKLNIYGDIVLNHRMGADDYELVAASKVDNEHRNNTIGDLKIIKAPTKYTFEGRKDKYSSFKWNWTHFSGVDYDALSDDKGPYLFATKSWNSDVDDEFDNYDYLMGTDLDFDNKETVEEVYNWTNWYLDISKIDGLRMDALKHISSSFMRDYIKHFKTIKKDLFVVGEYWNGDGNKLLKYLDDVDNELSLFDVALHFNMYKAATSNGEYDLREIFNDTIVASRPSNAVTFVDNHDTEPNQGLQSFIPDWFKPMAYALILLRDEGYPCVFYGDYYGISEANVKAKHEYIDLFIKLRQLHNHTTQDDYLDNPNVIGWVKDKENDPLVIIISDYNEGNKEMQVGQKWAGKTMSDIFGEEEDVVIDNDGNGTFKVAGGSLSIYTINNKKDND
ncbi:MAG: alpha-amylase [Thomasclavelia sp.]|nr:alpha-amylase [Thomasclavelia sp.]